MSKVCPECGERATNRPPAGAKNGWASSVDDRRLMWSHVDGEPLCPVMTDSGYQPALPVDA
jgi:hypothetical protein